MTKKELLEQTFQSKFELAQYKKFIVEFFNDAKLLNGEKRNDYWNWSEYSYYINGYYHVADYVDEKRNKIAIFAVELKKDKSLEKARSKQRNFIADRIKVMNYDGAIVAFYSADETELRWRLSFVRLDYELLKGKIKANFTPAKRYSYLLGVGEPCHTAKSQLYPILEEERFNPSIDKLEEAFSVEKVTKQFFEKYKEKYIELYEYLTQNDTFRDEAIRCVKSDNDDDISKFTEQFAKKLMGQVVFMYFLQKKGWLGVTAFPPKITEKEYKNAFFSCNDEHKQILKQLYVLDENGEYIRQARIINALSDDDQTYFAARIKGMAWETGPKDFVRILFKEAIKHNRNYFEYYLEPLFYEALNEKRDANNFYARLHCRIPFLNGGLFEPLDGYDWRHNNFSIPNEIFSNANIKGEREADGILDIFDRYNFTMNEDEPLEKEVAVDPEMLGKIFENLLDVKDRKSKGAFYTPREIVHYMCQESLINYIVNTVGTPYEDTKDFILYGEIMKDEDCSREVKSGAIDMLMPDSIYKNLKAIDDALADVRVADPAVGSGAFPMGMVNEIVKARENITAYFAREATAAQARQLWNYTRHPYMLKKDAMKNSIFAVDIEPSAVDITKLRLWLSLVVEFDINSENEEFRTPPTLPNLECNILCGNSLMDEFEGIKLFNDSLLTGASNNGNWMADLFQDQVDKTLEKLIEKQRELFYANNHDDKYRLKHEIDVLQQQVIFSSCTMTDDVKERVTSAFAMPSKPFILWKLAFAKVFKDKGGFDIVIGNPPYVGESGNKEIFRPIAKTGFGKRFYLGKMDLLYFFFHKGIDLTSDKGEIALITTNYFITATGAKKLRADFKARTQIRKFINFDEYKIFESALGQHNAITFLTKDKTQPIEMKSCFCRETGVFESGRLQKILEWTDQNSIYSVVPQDKIYDGENDYIRFNSQSLDSSAIQKMQQCKIRLKDLFLVNQGVVTGCDTFTKRHLEKMPLTDDIIINDGIYVLDFENPRDVEVYNQLSEGKALCRDFYKNSDIQRYQSSKKATKKLIYFEDALDCSKYPDVFAHLSRFKQLLESRLETYNEHYHWTAIHRSRVAQIFEGPKVVLPYRAKTNAFAYNEVEWFCRSDAYVVTPKQKDFSLKALLGILNSTLYLYWLKKQGKVKGEILELMREPIEQIPLPTVDSETLQIIESYVDDIIVKKENQESTESQEKALDDIVYSLFSLTSEEIALVEEAVK